MECGFAIADFGLLALMYVTVWRSGAHDANLPCGAVIVESGQWNDD